MQSFTADTCKCRMIGKDRVRLSWGVSERLSGGGSERLSGGGSGRGSERLSRGGSGRGSGGLQELFSRLPEGLSCCSVRMIPLLQ